MQRWLVTVKTKVCTKTYTLLKYLISGRDGTYTISRIQPTRRTRRCCPDVYGFGVEGLFIHGELVTVTKVLGRWRSQAGTCG
jgi:hypothetical protein